MFASLNQSEVFLEAVALEANGALKTNVATANVAVYVIDTGAKTEVLASTSMAGIGSVWHYVWEPTTLPVGEYIAEYTLEDDDGIVTTVAEDISVMDIATQSLVTEIQGSVDTIRSIEAGRWKILNNQMLFYGSDGVTPILTFNLFDADGNPTMTDLFERVPV